MVRCWSLRLWFYSLLCILAGGCTRVPEGMKTAERLMETAPDSSLHILQHMNPHKLYSPSNKALYALLMSQALDRNDIKVESDSIITTATDYYTEREPERAGYAWFYHSRTAGNRGNADEQANNLLIAQGFALKAGNHKLEGLIYGDKAKMYETQRQFDSMIHYNRLSLHSFQLIANSGNCVISLLKIGSGFLNVSKPDSAILYYRLAERLALSRHDTVEISTVYRSLGSVYYLEKNFQKALYYYKLAPLTPVTIYNSNKWYLMAKAYIQIGKLDSAQIFLNRIKELQEMSPDYYRLWQSIYEKEGNLKEALHAANKITEVKDSMNQRNLSVSFAGLEKKFKYQGLQLENRQLVIKNEQKGLLLLLVLVVLGIFIVIVSYWRLQDKKKQFVVQNKLLEKEKFLLEVEKDRIEKEKENNVLQEKQLKLQTILLLNIEQHRKNSIKMPGLWKNDSNKPDTDHKTIFFEELIACMDMEYTNISHRLLHDFPTLTNRDIIICCLLLADFDTGMIATIMDVQLESITKYRYRLRQKLKLVSAENLVEFLRQY